MSHLQAIRNVYNDYAEHINRPGTSCCKGCTLAVQIPDLLDEVDRLSAELAQASSERAALDVAVRGLRELEDRFADARDRTSEWIDDSGEHVAQTWELAGADVSVLLDKVGAKR